MHMLENPLLGMIPKDFTLFCSCEIKEIQKPTLLLFFWWGFTALQNENYWRKIMLFILAMIYIKHHKYGNM